MSRNRINEGFKSNRVASELFEIEREMGQPKKIKKDNKQFQVYINRQVVVCQKCFEPCKLPSDDINNEQTRKIIDKFKAEHVCQTN